MKSTVYMSTNGIEYYINRIIMFSSYLLHTSLYIEILLHYKLRQYNILDRYNNLINIEKLKVTLYITSLISYWVHLLLEEVEDLFYLILLNSSKLIVFFLVVYGQELKIFYHFLEFPQFHTYDSGFLEDWLRICE